MAKSHKIKQVIKSTEKTAVITQAMELVSASKLPNALSRLEQARPFSDVAKKMMKHYSSVTDIPHLKPRNNPKKHGIIVLGSDRGLCGSLNLNLFKQVIQKIRALEKEGKQVSLAVCGSKALNFFSPHVPIISQIEHLGDKPNLEDMMSLIQPLLASFESMDIDCIHIARNVFENTLTQTPCIEQVLPLSVDYLPNEVEHYTYEPDKKEVVMQLFQHYVESLIYRSVVENIACEQAARMMAMKNATDNAKEIIKDLNLTYNKIRQALITQEIAEISAGANYADGETL